MSRFSLLVGPIFLLPAAAPPLTAQQDSVRVVIQIQGIQGELERNARAVMMLARRAAQGRLPARRIPGLYQRGGTDIAAALRPYGYYEPRIASALEAGADQWTAHFVVDPGPVVRIRSVAIELEGEGADRPEFRARITEFPLRTGDTLHDPSYEAGKLALLGVASDSGYLDADFDTAVVMVDRDQRSADIRIRFNTGPRYRFGPVRFEPTILKESLLRTRVGFREGDFYRHDKLLEFQNALSEDPYFARVDVLPRREQAAGLAVPIDVLLAPRPRWTWEFGGGYGTDTGPRGRANAMWRYVNPSGHFADAEILASFVEQRAAARYNIPAVLHASGVLSFFGGFSRTSVNPHRQITPFGVTSRTITGGARLTRQRIGWREALSLSYVRTRFEIGVDSARTSLLIPAAGWERTRSDSRILPRSGLRTALDVQGSRRGLLANTSFFQVRASAKAVLGLLPRIRLITRGEVGRTFTGNLSSLPPQFRFFAGGDASVRGYRYLSLAPRDPRGQVLGGSSLIVGSAELDYQIMPRWLIATFLDAGNAMSRFGLADLRQGAGIGIRFVSPIGMIRVDAAVPLQPLPGMGRFRLHFSMGPDL